MTKFGYTEREIYMMQLGKWLDIYDTYKRTYNFEHKNKFYSVEEQEYGSVMDL